MRIATVTTAMCLSIVGLSAAAEVEAAIRKSTHIPAQELGSALNLLAQDRDFQVVYRSELIGNLRTGGASGEVTADEALTQLLSGTGLTYRYLADKAITIVPLAAVSPGSSSPVVMASAEKVPPLEATGSEARTPRVPPSVQTDLHRSFWSRLRLAQATQTSSAAPASDQRARSPVDDAAAGRIEEVIVTARFREEAIQDIGQSIVAFDQQTLERSGIEDFSDIARRTAGLDFNGRGPNANEESIRGIAKLVNQASLDILPGQPVVTQFVDDIPVSAPTARQRDFNLFDFARVEILRGPQPTYFGEGSVGGTIRYLSADPSLRSDTLGGKFAAQLSHTDGGDLNYEVDGAVDLTLVPDRLGVRVTGYRREDSGFIDNRRLAADNVNDFDSVGGRVVVLAKPLDDLTIRFAAHLANDDIGDDWVADNDSSSFTASFNPFLNHTEDDVRLYSLNASYDFGPLTATSVTGWYKRTITRGVYDAVQSLNSFPAIFGISGNTFTTNLVDDDNFTQELRLVSDLDGPVNFTAGIFYKDSETGQAASSHSADIAALDIMGRDLLFTINGGRRGGTVRKHKAAFFEINVEPIERLHLIGGLRWMDERLTTPTGVGPGVGDEPSIALCIATANGTPRPIFGVNPCVRSTLLTSNQLFAGIPGAANLTEVVNDVHDVLPKGAIEFAVNDDVLLYASAAKGLRNGGVNSPFVVAFATELTLNNESLTFGPDSLWAYEAGAKTSWLDGGLILNLGAYYNRWEDIQVFEQTSAGALIVNAPAARSVGAELEANWRIHRHVNAYFAGNYTQSEFTKSMVLATPQAAAIAALFGAPVAQVVDGNRLPNVPEWKFSIGADVRAPVTTLFGKPVDFIGVADYQYTGDRFTNLANTSANALDAYGIANVRAGLGGENWEVIGFVTNVTNEIVNQSFLRVGPGGILNPHYINQPRTFGLSVRRSF